MLLELPDEMLHGIMLHLDPGSLVQCCCTSDRLHLIGTDADFRAEWLHRHREAYEQVREVGRLRESFSTLDNEELEVEIDEQVGSTSRHVEDPFALRHCLTDGDAMIVHFKRPRPPGEHRRRRHREAEIAQRHALTVQEQQRRYFESLENEALEEERGGC